MGERNKHREDVIAAVRKRGSSLSALAAREKIHPSSLSHCLTRPLRRANTIIARFLGLPLSALWPEWFDEAENLKPRLHASRKREGGNPVLAPRKVA